MLQDIPRVFARSEKKKIRKHSSARAVARAVQ